MSWFRSFPAPKLAVGALVAVAAGAIYVASLPKADALAGPSICTYYQNANYRTAVGARGTGCCGTIVSWGVKSPYRKCKTVNCTQEICDMPTGPNSSN